MAFVKVDAAPDEAVDEDFHIALRAVTSGNTPAKSGAIVGKRCSNLGRWPAGANPVACVGTDQPGFGAMNEALRARATRNFAVGPV